DPTVNDLEKKVAQMFGMEAALFCPSGTMTNQIAIRIHTQPQTEVICDKSSHIYLYEGGGIASNSFASVRLIEGDRGRITAEQVLENIQPDDVHAPTTSLVSLENTMNKGGGCFYEKDQITSIREVCKKKDLALHLDGARLFNAIVETEETPAFFGAHFDTISICLSKGLGAPVGSLLLGSKKNIHQAKKVRKVFGGGMRQAGYLAAAGIYALNNNIDRLIEDHQRARVLEETLKKCSYVDSTLPVATNIVIFKLQEKFTVEEILSKMDAAGLKAVRFGKKEIRLVTHLDFNDEMLERATKILRSLV
ncbi:threonine aldolase family protein, partial [Xanthovirga aplysinae]|uniref:threonine aldolase family protein n=1 Tax=Xanthovirga aplysinae TaxID=2529853 RepID=UPI0012BD0C2D